MATRTGVASWVRQIDDWTVPCWSSVVDEDGEGRGPIAIHWPEFSKFCKNRDRGLLQVATSALLRAGKFEVIRAVLLKHLSVVLIWSKMPDPNPKSRHIEPWQADHRRKGRLLSIRSAEVCIWMIGCGLPAIPGVNWDRLAILLAKIRTRHAGVRKAIRPSIQDIRDIIESGVVQNSAIKTRRNRTASGETPKYIEEAIVLLKQSDGTRSDRSIAAELNCDHSMLSRSLHFRAAKALYAKDKSKNHKKLEADARRSGTTVADLLANMSTNMPDDE